MTANITKSIEIELKLTPVTHCPRRPENEFTQMNKAETADASLMLPQLKNKIIGERIIPPPIPISPDIKPMQIPKIKAPR